MLKFNIKLFRINAIASHLTIVEVDYITVTSHLFSSSLHQLFFYNLVLLKILKSFR